MTPVLLLLSVAIPIFVHLVHKERKEPLAFPSLMFLRRVPFRSAKRQRIRYWLLFLMRTAALILIASAFARPWLNRGNEATGAARGGKDVVILVDRSYSMSAREVWDRAQRELREAVDGAGTQDRVALIAFGEQAQVLTRLDEPRSYAQAAAQNIEPGSESTRFAPAFKLAGSVLANSRGPAEIVVITDRQRSGWRNLEQVPTPPNTTVRVIDVAKSSLQNVSVTDVELAKSMFAGRQRIVPSGRLINRSDRAVTVPVELRLNDRTQQSRNVTVPAHGVAPIAFDAMFAASAVGEIRVAQDDDVAIDNSAFFTTESSGTPTVRVVSGNSDASFYFESALGAGGASGFQVHRATAQISAADLAAANVLVFLDANIPGGTAGERIKEFVRQGGSVLIASAGETRGEGLALLKNPGATSRDANPASLVSIDALHPVFEPFRASSAGQFASARINRYQRGDAADAAQVIARFDDGAPALLEQRFGRGRVLHFASSFTRAAGDLVLQPVFVPFVQQLVKHAASGRDTRASFTVGNVIDINSFAPSDRDAVVLTPGGERIRIGASANSRSLRISEAGIYQVRGTGDAAATQMFAANVDPAESDVTPVAANLFDDAITARSANSAVLPAALQPRDREGQQKIWWYLLLLAFAFLAIETFVGNRISTAWRT